MKELVSKWKRYGTLFIHFFGFEVKQLIVYRTDFWLFLLVPTLWLFAQLLFLEVIYRQVPSIRGWNHHEMMLLLGMHQLFFGTHFVFISPNMRYLSKWVHEGTLDMFLTKPCSLQFIISTQRANLHFVSVILFGIGTILYALKRLHFSPSPTQWLLAGALLVMGLSIYYAIALIFASLSFRIVQSDNIFSLWELNSSEFDRYPGELFQGIVGFTIYFVIPLFLFSYVPIQTLLGRENPLHIFYAVFLALILLKISKWFFYNGLKNYSSASS